MIYNLGILSFLGSFLSKGLDLIPGAVINAIRSLMFTFTIFIYDLIIKLYDMFLALCNVRLLSNDILQELSRRVGYILGVVMLFYVILGFIQLLLNPDAINDGEKGATAIIKKTIIVIVMLGSANFAFELLYQVQVTVVNSNIISRLLLPYSVTPIVNGQESSDNDSSSSVLNNKIFGNLLAEELLSSFYKVEEFDESDISSSADTSSYENCQTVVNNFRNQIINYGSFDLGYTCLNETIVVDFKIDDSTKSDEQETMIVNFNLLLSPLVGLCAVYILVMYCFKVGVRMVQLMFLEIISPMAIVSYLAPKKDTMFNKWKNIYISTYIDVFIRIAIINFAFFLVTTIFSTTGGTGLEFNGTDYSKNDFFIVVMVLSVLTFAKKAPELVGELLPKSASKLGFGASMKDIVGLTALTGLAVGGVGGAIGGAIGSRSPIGLIKGLINGGRKGFSGKNPLNSAKSGYGSGHEYGMQRHQRIVEGGSHFPIPGAKRRLENLNKEKTKLESQNTALKDITSHHDNIKKRAESQVLGGKFNSNAKGLKAYNAAQELETAKQRAGNIKRADFASGRSGDAAYDVAVRKAQADIVKAQRNAIASLDDAIAEYANTSGDAVVANEMALANNTITINKELKLNTVSNFADLKSVNGTANGMITDNSVRLAQNASEGEKLRVDAKYGSNKK